MTLESKNLVAVVDSRSSKQCYQRPNNMKKKIIKIIASKKKLLDPKSVKLKLCEDYIIGKQRKLGQFSEKINKL